MVKNQELEIAGRFGLIPSPEECRDSSLSCQIFKDSWMSLCRQPGDLYESYAIAQDKEQAIRDAAYGPEAERNQQIEFGTFYVFSWVVDRNGRNHFGQAVTTKDKLLYHREED